MLDNKERAKKSLRLLVETFDDFINRIIEHSDTTPGLINADLIKKVSDLITSFEKEKSEVSRKITEYFEDINKELKNEEYFNKVIDALDISEGLKDQCRQMLQRHVFTEEQFKIYLGSIRQVYQETKEYYEKQSPPEPQFEDPLEQIHHYYQSGQRFSNSPQ